ncbi:MAG: SpoIIE family protein phosphatase [Actinomycetes bacterium]
MSGLGVGRRDDRSWFDGVGDALWAVDSHGSVVGDSQSWRDFTGQNFAELRDAGWLGAIHPQDRPRVTALWRAATESEGDFGAIFRLHTRDDGYHSVVGRLVPMPLNQGLEWVGLLIDLDKTSGDPAPHALVDSSSLGSRTEFDLEMRLLEMRLSRALTTDEVIKVVVEESKALVGAFGAIYIEEEQEGALDVVSQSGMPLDAGAGWRRVPRDHDFAGAEAFRSGSAVADESRLADGIVFHAVPVWADGDLLGSLTYAGDPSALGDATLMLEVGRILGRTLDRARAFDRERSIALSLQRGMLPTTLPTIDGAELGVAYRPGSSDADVGGDWFESIRLKDGRLLLTVGDVMGKGLPAASTMNEFRYALRALSVVSSSPQVLLEALASYHSELSGDKQQILTLLVALYDPSSGKLQWASAGHIPPVLVRRRRGVADVEISEDGQGAPLGVGAQWPMGERRLVDGDVLLLISDGLVEDRQRTLDRGFEQLRQVCSDLPTQSAAEVCDHVLGRMVDQDSLADDVTLLCLKIDVGHEDVRWTLPADPASVGRARFHIQTELARLAVEDPEVIETVMLLTSELATNAMRHSTTDIVVCLERIDRLLRVSVWDSDPHLDLAPRHLEVDAEHGRGLHLVDVLSGSWGVTAQGVGKEVWFELDLSR